MGRPRNKEINTVAFEKEMRTHQGRTASSIRGRAIKAALLDYLEECPKEIIEDEDKIIISFSTDLSRHVSVINAIIRAYEYNHRDPAFGYISIAVEYLFSLISPYSADAFLEGGTNGKQVRYMSQLTKEVIDPLNHAGIISVNFHSVALHKCRQFHLMRKFYDKFKEHFKTILYQSRADKPKDEFIEELGKRKLGRGEGFRDANKITIAAWEKVSSSRFVFKSDLYYNSPEGAALCDEYVGSLSSQMALMYAMDGLNHLTNQPQYPIHYHLQKSGRMHTRGGAMFFTKWFRQAFIGATNPLNAVVEVDLKCAQLIVLANILGGEETLKAIRNIIDSGDSVWNYIGGNHIPKEIKKVVVYSFCFGANIKDIPYLAKCEIERRGLNIRVTKADIDECLQVGLLSELIYLRNEWMSNYTCEKIVEEDLWVVNELGVKLYLKEEAKEMLAITGKKVKRGASTYTKKVNNADSTKIAGRYLAHLAQGSEQFVIQSLIAEAVNENILCFQYDGFTIECAYDEIPVITHRYKNFLSTRFPSYSLDIQVLGASSPELSHKLASQICK